MPHGANTRLRHPCDGVTLYVFIEGTLLGAKEGTLLSVYSVPIYLPYMCILFTHFHI